MCSFRSILHPGAERCDTDAARQPQLFLGREVWTEPPPGAFYDHTFALSNRRYNVSRVVAQSFDRKGKRPVVIDARHRERMLLMTGRTEECKFTVTNVNGFFGLNRDERQAVVRVDVNDLSIHGFFPPSAAYQEFQRVVTTDDGHGNVDPTERCKDVGRFHQSDAVDSQNQEKNGEKFVGAQPLVIPHDRNKRHDKENQAKQRRPFGRFDGKSAHPGPERIKTGQFAAHNFGD